MHSFFAKTKTIYKIKRGNAMSCGMVRKVDELGRVVVPKEMRRVLGIKPGSSIEMSIDVDNNVVLKKFSEIENLQSFAQIIADILFEMTYGPVFICDDEKVVVSKGVPKKNIEEISLKEILEKNPVEKINFLGYSNAFLTEIKCEGSISGYIILLSENLIPEENKKMCEIASKIFAKLICS